MYCVSHLLPENFVKTQLIGKKVLSGGGGKTTIPTLEVELRRNHNKPSYNKNYEKAFRK